MNGVHLILTTSVERDVMRTGCVTIVFAIPEILVGRTHLNTKS
jgi:hypothetical protein